MKNIWRVFIVFLSSLCMVSSVSADSETLDIDWSDVEMTVSIEASSGVIAVSGSAPSSTKYNTTVTLTGALTGEPQYNTVEYEHTKTEWSLSISGLTLNSVTEGKLDQWQEESTVKCTRYGTSSGKVLVGGTAKVRYTFTKIDDPSITTESTLSGSVSDGTNGTEDKRATAWIVGVDNLKWRKTGETGWGTDGNKLKVAKGKSLEFKAERTPTGSPSWPDGWSKWSGEASGTGETTTVTFNNVSASNAESDKKEVKVKCGTSEKSAKILVYELDKLQFKLDGSWYGERFPFVGDGQGCSFALKGQHKPARRNAAGNGKHSQRPERAIDH